MGHQPTNYWGYIRVEELLGLQGGIEADDRGLSNDEVLFIAIHQIDELWFKLALRELKTIRDLFRQERVPEQALGAAVRSTRRVAEIFRQAAHHFGLMETMTTRDYLAFRDKLSPASGFQSAQMREIEILVGLSDADRIPLGRKASYLEALRNPDGSESAAYRRVKARQADGPSVREVMEEWLYRSPIEGSCPDDPEDERVVERFSRAYRDAHAKEVKRAQRLATHEGMTAAERERLNERFESEIRSASAFLAGSDAPEAERRRRARIRVALLLIEGYRELPLLAWPRELVDAIVAMEQALTMFRQRHARMVERMIGRRTGTGGSAGVAYLDQTALRYRVFHDIWAIRTLQIRAAALPALQNPSAYDLLAGD